MSKPFYLTTTLPYVNADPHIGFALEIVQADILVRYRELIGDNVFFTTGTDEHGQKIYEASKKVGKTPQEYTDEYAAKFRSLKEKLDLHSNIHFIRTTEEKHVIAAQEIWRRCLAAGDIEKRTYKGLYCVGDEAFIKETDLVNGRCPNHPNMDPVELEEENYFFLLSKYQKPILEYLSREGVVVPEWRRQEAIKFVERWNLVQLKAPNDPPTYETPLGRRGFVSLAVGCAASLMGGAGLATATKVFGAGLDAPDAVLPVRPPGSVPEDDFLRMCIRCGECFNAPRRNVMEKTGRFRRTRERRCGGAVRATPRCRNTRRAWHGRPSHRTPGSIRRASSRTRAIPA